MSSTFFHGTDKAFAKHIGLCLALEERTARNYTRTCFGKVFEIELEEEGLTVEEIDGYDTDSNTAVGDVGTDVDSDADILVYSDMDPEGNTHTTYRLMTQRALDAIITAEEI